MLQSGCAQTPQSLCSHTSSHQSFHPLLMDLCVHQEQVQSQAVFKSAPCFTLYGPSWVSPVCVCTGDLPFKPLISLLLTPSCGCILRLKELRGSPLISHPCSYYDGQSHWAQVSLSSSSQPALPCSGRALKLPEQTDGGSSPRQEDRRVPFFVPQICQFFISKYFSIVVCLCLVSKALKWLFLTILSSVIVVPWGDFLMTSLFYHNQKSCPDRCILTKKRRGRRQRPWQGPVGAVAIRCPE